MILLATGYVEDQIVIQPTTTTTTTTTTIQTTTTTITTTTTTTTLCGNEGQVPCNETYCLPNHKLIDGLCQPTYARYRITDEGGCGGWIPRR